MSRVDKYSEKNRKEVDTIIEAMIVKRATNVRAIAWETGLSTKTIIVRIEDYRLKPQMNNVKRRWQKSFKKQMK